MFSQPMAARKRATAERARSLALRRRAVKLREEADLVSVALVETIGNFEGGPVGGRGDSFSLRVPALPVTLRLVRRQLRRWLESRGLARDVAADLTLASSEACANAMEHPRSAAHPAVEIQARVRSAQVEVIVRDFGSWSARTREGNRGRGLEMIRALVDDVSVANDERGTTVTIRRSLGNR